MEQWLPVQEFPWYLVGEEGNVRRVNSEQLLRVSIVTGGNPCVSLQDNEGRWVKRGLAALVCHAFVQFPTHRCDTPTPIHLDGDRMNCRASNLQWRPRWFAQKHARQFNQDLHNDHGVRNIDTGVVYENIWDVVFEQGVLFNEVVMAVINKTYVFPLFQRFEWA